MVTHKRNEETMMQLIIQTAEKDDRIRGVIMNGSRASPSALKDRFQDYDIVYIVTNVAPFVEDEKWIDRFGEILISQTPDKMDNHWPNNQGQFTYLMLFTDQNRIDLKLIQSSKFLTMSPDSQSIILLDKDHLLGNLKAPSDEDYLPKPPTEIEFLNCCNEFLWVSTYVAKGIYRKQLTYAKYMSEQIIKNELIKLLTWDAGIQTNCAIPSGHHGKYLEKYTDPKIWSKFCQTYTGADYEEIWDGLFVMCELFDQFALKISSYYQFAYDKDQYENVISYLRTVRTWEGRNSGV